MSFALIAAEKAHHSVSLMARVLSVSRAGYYAWAGRGPSLRRQADERLTARVTAIHAATRGIYGRTSADDRHMKCQESSCEQEKGVPKPEGVVLLRRA